MLVARSPRLVIVSVQDHLDGCGMVLRNDIVIVVSDMDGHRHADETPVDQRRDHERGRKDSRRSPCPSTARLA